MRVEKVSSDVLVLKERKSIALQLLAVSLGILGIVLYSLVPNPLWSYAAFLLSLGGVATNGFSTHITIDKKKGSIVHSKQLLYIPVVSNWIELDEVERVESVAFLSENDLGKASDEYFQQIAKQVKENVAATYTIGIRNGVGNWRILCRGDQNSSQYEYAANAVNAFLNESNVYAL